MGRRGDGADARFGRAAVGRPAPETDLEPLQALVTDRHAVRRRLADDRALGPQAAADEGLGSEALHLLVDDGRERDLPGREPARVADVDQGPGHGGQGSLHVHGAAAEHPAFAGRAREEFGLRAGVRRHGIEVAAEDEMGPGLRPGDRREDVRPPGPDLDELGRDAAPAEIGRQRLRGRFLLPLDARVARRLDHLQEKLEDAPVVHDASFRPAFAGTIREDAARFNRPRGLHAPCGKILA